MNRRLRLLAAALLFLLLIGAPIAAHIWPGLLGAGVQSALTKVHNAGEWGVAAFVLAQILIAASGVLPASIVGIAAGAVYGILLGFTVASLSIMIGAWLAFRAARSLFRPRVQNWLAGRPRLANLDAGLARERWRLVCLMRVSPIMPFAATSYTLGISAVSERDYLLGTLAALPALLGYVCLGSLAHASLNAGLGHARPFRWVLLILGFAATAVLTLRIGQLAARALGTSASKGLQT